MANVFVILLIVAIIGVFRPYKFLPQVVRWHYGLAVFASFIAIGITAPEEAQTTNTVTNSEARNAAAVAAIDEPAKKIDETPISKWDYDTQADEMRGSVTKYATLGSENMIDFDFPYGKQIGIITVRKDRENGLNVMFSVPSGQILCHSFDDSYLSAKFDDGPIRKFKCTGTSDGSSEVSFVVNPKQFLTGLKSADRTVIEAEFFQAGRQQYIFDTRNLNWEN